MSNIDPIDSNLIPQNILDAYWFARSTPNTDAGNSIRQALMRISEPEFVGTMPSRVDLRVEPREIQQMEEQPTFFDISYVNHPTTTDTWYNPDITTPTYNEELERMTAYIYQSMVVPKEILEPEQPKIPPRHITNAIMELEL